MKLIRIGSSPACDIVLNSKFVSALHAEVTVLDNGDVIIEDKNSSNGTTVGTRKIDPNIEVTIHRGDYVRIADVDLPWHRIPQPTKLNQYNSIVNIGSNFRNSIVVTGGAVSRYHAILKVDKKGKAFICDNNSKNGTELNGERLTPERDYPVRRGDTILVAGEDVSDQIQQYLPKSMFSGGLFKGVAAVLIACLLGVGGWWAATHIGGGEYEKAAVYVQTAYHYNVTAKTPFGDVTFRYPESTDNYVYASGTAFFLDREGRLGTARHLIMPWAKEYNTEENNDALEAEIKEWLGEQLFMCNDNNDVARLVKKSNVGKILVNGANSGAQLNYHIMQLIEAPLQLSGEMDFIAIGYSGQQYMSLSEFKRCDVLGDSKDPEKDVAIIQLNDKETPKNIKSVFDVDKISGKIEVKPADTELLTAGFPYGLLWGRDNHSKKIESTLRKTICTKTPNRYNFEFQESSQGGASGSPVYKKDGTLVGVLSAVRVGQHGPTIACHALFMKDLYKSVTSDIAK